MRKIIHVDMDAFFVAVEIRDDPTLQGKPVAVGGRLNSRGVLSTCNYIAREYGLRSAMPTHVALRKCPDLVLVAARMSAYKAVSVQLRAIFERYTDLIEPLSLDEAYLDVTHCDLHNGSATLIAQDICHTIEQELNLTASAGVAPLKFLAKIASDINKPKGIYVIPPHDVDGFIDHMPLNKIPGVGKVTDEKLKAHQLYLGRDIKSANKPFLLAQFGKLGQLLWQRCHGIDDRDIVTTRERKSVGVEQTFPEDIADVSQLTTFLKMTLLPTLKKRAARYLPDKGISKIGIKVKFSDFQQTTKECSLKVFDDARFLELLVEAIKRGGGKKVRLLGVHIGLSSPQQASHQYSFSW